MAEMTNIAETLAQELKTPVELFESTDPEGLNRVALPPGWKVETFDNLKHFPAPMRKTAKVTTNDMQSFIDYLRRHGSLINCSVWCNADYSKGEADFLGIINDHGDNPDDPQWRDHTIAYSPFFSEEWKRWKSFDAKHFSQIEFAAFLEENLKDISGANGATGAQMLEMALSFEANQDMRFKSAIRLQNGGVQMSFVQDDDAQTLTKMQMFDRFSLGIPVFWNGQAYQIDARLRYRPRDGKVFFWYELIREDKVFEDATKTLIAQIREGVGAPFFFGNPFAK